MLTRLGLVCGVNLISRFLEQKAHQLGGRFEDGGADEHFDLLDSLAVGGSGLKARD